MFSCSLFQVGMDKALKQLSVPLGQLREEVLVRSGMTLGSVHMSLDGLSSPMCVTESPVVCERCDPGDR